jgi:hypothetical protein
MGASFHVIVCFSHYRLLCAGAGCESKSRRFRACHNSSILSVDKVASTCALHQIIFKNFPQDRVRLMKYEAGSL